MKLTKNVLLFLVTLAGVVVWQSSLAPLWGLIFLNLALIVGLLLNFFKGSGFLFWWVLATGVLLDLVFMNSIGIYLSALVLSLVVWGYVYEKLTEEILILHRFLKAVGSVLIYELVLFVLFGFLYPGRVELGLDFGLRVLWEVIVVSIIYVAISWFMFRRKK